MHQRKSAIQRLQIHLPNQQTVTFGNDTDIVIFLNNDRLQKTILMEFFITNKQAETEAAAAAVDGRPPLDFDCRELLYQEFPIHMTWYRKYHRWHRRKKGIGGTIGRIYFVDPSGGERFYLRLLLIVVKGPTSFDDLHTFDGILYDTFKAACITRGLLDSDEQ
jgi:hypothetical protein